MKTEADTCRTYIIPNLLSTQKMWQSAVRVIGQLQPMTHEELPPGAAGGIPSRKATMSVLRPSREAFKGEL